MSFKKTLGQFNRKTEIDVEVAGTEDTNGDNLFTVTVRHASRHNQIFRAKAAEFAATNTGARKGKKIRLGATGARLTDALTGTDDPRQDAEFFFLVFVVKWKNLRDDDGKSVKPSIEAARDLFGTEQGQVLMELLLAEATNDENFVNRETEEREIAGE